MSRNPYPRRPGFGLRYFRAARAIRNYGLGWTQEQAGLYTRGFDGCFENNDGDAVVWQLMREAQTDENIAHGIRRMGEKVWPQWHAIYTATLLKI